MYMTVTSFLLYMIEHMYYIYRTNKTKSYWVVRYLIWFYFKFNTGIVFFFSMLGRDNNIYFSQILNYSLINVRVYVSSLYIIHKYIANPFKIIFFKMEGTD